MSRNKTVVSRNVKKYMTGNSTENASSRIASVNMGSIASNNGGSGTTTPHYGPAKAAVAALGRSLAQTYAKHNINVNTIAPGNVLIPGGSWEAKISEKPDQVKKYIKSEVPLGRFADPVEIANAATFLASSRARFISGALLCIDGAQTH